MTSRPTLTIVTTLTTLALLAGCGQRAAENMIENAMERETGQDAQVDVNRDGSMRIETEDGTFTAGGTAMPDGWPEDAPAYPGATVSYAGTMNPATGKSGMAAILMTQDGGDAVAAYYKDRLTRDGWKIDTTMLGGDMSIVSATKDDRTLSIAVATANGQTTITMGVEGEEK